MVLELSSWQLQGFHDAKLSPRVAVFTNIHPDHLNRYAGMDEYIHDKKAIFLYQSGTDYCIFNGDQARTRELAKEAPQARASSVPRTCRQLGISRFRAGTTGKMWPQQYALPGK